MRSNNMARASSPSPSSPKWLLRGDNISNNSDGEDPRERKKKKSGAASSSTSPSGISCVVIAVFVGTFVVIALALARASQWNTEEYSNPSSSLSSSSSSRTSSNDNKPPPPPPQFVFFAGVEGSGHRFLARLITEMRQRRNQQRQQLDQSGGGGGGAVRGGSNNSPDGRNSNTQGKITTTYDSTDSSIESDDVRRLQKVLFSPQSGLMHLHCKATANTKRVVETRRQAVALFVKIAEQQQQYETTKINTTTTPRATTIIPLNDVSVSTSRYSYPQDDFALCRSYPNLDLLYSICDGANVDCRHVYLYRNDPRRLLSSKASRRHYEARRITLQAMHEYTTMLNVLYGQLSRYPNRTLGCFNFFDGGVYGGDDAIFAAETTWGSFLRDMIGWPFNDRTEFEELVRSTLAKEGEDGSARDDDFSFSDNSNDNDDDDMEVGEGNTATAVTITTARSSTSERRIPYECFMRSLVQASYSVAELCHSQLEENNDGIPSRTKANRWW